MSGGSSSNKEFLEQLRMQEMYGQRNAGGLDPYTYTDPEDGTVYDWDHEKKAWFPKITEDFLAAYQANYGFNEEGNPDANCATAASSEPATSEQSTKLLVTEKPAEVTQTLTPEAQEAKPDHTQDVKQKGEKRKAEQGWFDIDEDKNTNVYVSGLPPDIGVDEFVELMSKCGIVMKDPITEEYKVKLYKDKEGNLKGDGLCCYLKKESVELAVRLIDESEVRGYKLHVEAARFELKGAYDASKKKKKNKDYKKKLKMQQKQLDWKPEKQGDIRKKHEKVVIIRNMFHPSDFEEDPLVLNEYREDLRTECEKFGGVKKVLIFDRHPDGVASVAFKDPDQADACIQSFNGRWFGGRQLSALPWDGTTDFQVEETSREREERLKGWSSFLESGEKAQVGETASTAKPPQEGATTTNTNSTPKPESNPAKEPQSMQDTEEDMDSTDSSLVGSDEEA
ncbi:HIV Tat-specific factor 1 [Periophthalmus magnuspinnatus]|uniref:17S U2 SnRNP complex component HTATSF1 n=1 Tax=Periophthalmus magnuspinnatus TaxID=409849 RepID=A0A3B3ZSJ0_9GOBI|nr:HIV Tat-specific factor 1 [Periophthalmus magnuspinnatus]XP_055082816.1 HIV Tat-specific factor 1 [Periophthalmus magnuspinnatus]